MSADKRTVHTDALATLGTIIGPEEKRDAIHLGVVPVIAAEDLLPGQHVGFVEGGVGRAVKTVGIVDPFIEGAIHKGERFWLVVYPRKITSLRHVWTHPDVPDDMDSMQIAETTTASLPAPKKTVAPAPRVSPKKAAQVVVAPTPAPTPAPAPSVPKEDERKAYSKRYIEELANRVGISYNRLVDGATDWMESQQSGRYGSYITGGAQMEGEYVPDDFWMHYEIVTGTPVPDELRGSFFSCSC